MIKVKKIIAIVLGFAAIVSLSACRGEQYTDSEKFAARANLTIDRNIHSYLPEAINYTFTTLEYYEDGSAKVIRADCNFRIGAGLDLERRAFLLSDRQDYLTRFNTRNDTDYSITQDAYTELWYINLGGDYIFIANENNLVDSKKARDLVLKYRENNNKSYLGME